MCNSFQKIVKSMNYTLSTYDGVYLIENGEGDAVYYSNLNVALNRLLYLSKRKTTGTSINIDLKIYDDIDERMWKLVKSDLKRCINSFVDVDEISILKNKYVGL